MPNIILENKNKILEEWQRIVRQTIPAASEQSQPALYDSLPEFLREIAAIVGPSDGAQEEGREGRDHFVGRMHGKNRAVNNYQIDQMISEYFILRNIIMRFLREEGMMNLDLNEKITYAFQNAIQSSAAQFSRSLFDSQENFIMTLTHDLRSPLMVIKMQVEVLEKKKVLDHEAAEKFNRSILKIDRMLEHLLNTIKSRGSIEAFLDAQEFDFKEMVTRIVNEFEDSYPGIFKIIGEKTLVKWNLHSMERVMDNLIANALKYGDTTKEITIKMHRDDEYVFFSIHNHGEAIPYEKQMTLFKKFHRSDSTHSKSGWGIGLSFVKMIIEAHKGIVMVNSDKTGTTFKFELPQNIDKE